MRDPKSKIKHIEACLLPESQYQKSNGFECINLPNEAGAPISLKTIDLTTTFCDKKFNAPLMIAPMTGGLERGAELNRLWARLAEEFQIPMSVGSQRIAIEEGDRAGFFQIRKYAPTAFVFGNLGAANLTRANAVDVALKAVSMVDANALFIHFNAVQEACQKGDTDFTEGLVCLELICNALRKDDIKVFAREVGFGISKKAAARFMATGVDGIDCSGAGGTSWARVEAMCADNDESARLGLVFAEWGIPTAESVQNVRLTCPKMPLIASGGIRTGLDIAKALYLGADLAAMARPMLCAASLGEDGLVDFLKDTLHELKIAMFACGALDVYALKNHSVNFGQSLSGSHSGSGRII